MSSSTSLPLRAAGAVVWRADGDEPEIALRPRADGGWALPETAATAGETDLEAAVRAAAAHAAAAAPGRFLGTTRDRVDTPDGPRPRLRTRWALESLVDGPGPGEWAPATQAVALLGDEVERALVAAFLAGPRRVGRVILMRHCEAEQWRDGDDLLRPLTDVGRARAARLTGVVGALRPDVLVASPALRCRDTLGPAAAVLGVEVVEDAAVGEREPDRDRVAATLRARGRAGESVLVCTHAPVVAALLERFAATRPSLLPRPARLDAGGAWCAEFDTDDLVGLHYLPPPTPAEEPS